MAKTKPNVVSKITGDEFSATELNSIVNHFELKAETKADIDLGNVDNTADINKEVSIPQQAAFNLKSNLSSSMGIVVHGSNASMARPVGYSSVTWIGTVEPENSVNSDVWKSTAADISIPAIAGSGTFAVSDGTVNYTVNLSSAPVGTLMIVAIYHTQAVITYTPPAGWDIIHGTQGVNVYARVKQSGDSNTFVFNSNSTMPNGLASFYITGANYINSASITVGAPTAISSNTGKTIPGITLTKPGLLIAFTMASQNAPTVTTEGFTFYQAFPDYWSPFRYVTVYRKPQTELVTGGVVYTNPADLNSGLLMAVYN